MTKKSYVSSKGETWEWEETSDWLEANQNVNEIGGWQYYSREDSEKTQ